MTENQIENSNELGALLTRAREKLSFSQKDIASKLNLKVEFIAALDANDFDKLPAPTYVRGYIRSYACAVNLNADSLINLYEGSAEAPPEILPDVKPVVQASSRDKPVKAMTYLVTLTLVIMIIAWWQGQHMVGTGFFTGNSKTSEGGKYPGGFTYTYDVVNHPDTFEASEIDGIELDDSDLKNMKIVDLAKTSKSKPDVVSSTEDSLNQNAQTNLGTLKMELTAESWIEVYDVLEERLYRGLAKRGEIINITGAAPLSVKLGNARAVSVNFRGNAFDTSKYTKAGVARFILE